MDSGRRFLFGSAAVLTSMVLLFTVPPMDFAAATFVSTSCMLLASFAVGLRWNRRPSASVVLVGIATAMVLYLLFLAGNLGIKAFHSLGIEASNAASIYSLIASPSIPLYIQVGVLLFDAAGYESFFRGVLQARLNPRFGAGAAPLVAAFDAAVHVITLNPLWVVTTFIADLTWGLTYHYSKELSASFISHLVWDIAIFIAFPIR